MHWWQVHYRGPEHTWKAGRVLSWSHYWPIGGCYFNHETRAVEWLRWMRDDRRLVWC